MRRLCSEQSDMMQEVEFSKPLSMIEITEKTQIVRAICTHYVLLRCKAEQVQTGLSTWGWWTNCVQTLVYSSHILPDANANLTGCI